MTASTKEIQALLQKSRVYIEQLNDLLEERDRLLSVLKLTPSNAENMDVINLLGKIKAGLTYTSEDLQSITSKELSDEFSEILHFYSSTISTLKEDPYVNIEEYIFENKLPKACDVAVKKSVRFKDLEDNDNDNDDEDTTHMRNKLMGTSMNYKPYKDTQEEEDVNSDRNTLSSVDTSNQEMFAQNQQQLLRQDESLDSLHQSIRQQHSMGLDINDELDDHLVILNDLEQGVDRSHTRIRRATNGVVNFRRKVSENGSLVTIIVLMVILIILLVVLN